MMAMTREMRDGMKTGFCGVLRNERTRQANLAVVLCRQERTGSVFVGRVVSLTRNGTYATVHNQDNGLFFVSGIPEADIVRRIA